MSKAGNRWGFTEFKLEEVATWRYLHPNSCMECVKDHMVFGYEESSTGAERNG